MSNDFFAYSENPAHYRAALIRSIEEAGQVGHEQLAELRAMNGTLDAVLAEMDAIRRTTAAGVALQAQALSVQQAMLAREVFQDRLEEFVYQFEKMVGQFQQPDAECPPSTQYFLLDGVFRQIADAAISTAVIKGRDNKAAFDGCVTKGRTLFRQLAGRPDVKEALAWAEGEKQRWQIEGEKSRREREAEEQRRRAEEERRLEERRNAKVRLRIVLSGFATLGAAYKAFTAHVLIDGEPAGDGNLVQGFSVDAEVEQGRHSVEISITKPDTWLSRNLNNLPDLKKHHVVTLGDKPKHILIVGYTTKSFGKMFFKPGGEWLEFEFSLT